MLHVTHMQNQRRSTRATRSACLHSIGACMTRAAGKCMINVYVQELGRTCSICVWMEINFVAYSTLLKFVPQHDATHRRGFPGGHFHHSEESLSNQNRPVCFDASEQSIGSSSIAQSTRQRNVHFLEHTFDDVRCNFLMAFF